MAAFSEQAEEFVDSLNRLLHVTIGPDSRFVAIASENDERAIWVQGMSAYDGASSLKNAFIDLPRACDEGGPHRAALKVAYTLGMDETGDYLTVTQSTFGLWVKVADSGKHRPVFRMEYDRHARNKPAAHVHLHAESVELGWMYGTAGVDLPRQEEIHFPQGGHRFRPSFEELLLFLDRERLFTDWATTGWEKAVKASLDEFHQRQARATVRSNMDVAIEYLREQGYTVTEPG